MYASKAVVTVALAGIALTIVIARGPELMRELLRTEGLPVGESVQWERGTVAVFDYCAFPGAFDCQVEWVNAEGDRKVLLQVGDSVPNLSVLPNGNLAATYARRGHTGPWFRAVWKRANAGPTVESYVGHPE